MPITTTSEPMPVQNLANEDAFALDRIKLPKQDARLSELPQLDYQTVCAELKQCVKNGSTIGLVVYCQDAPPPHQLAVIVYRLAEGQEVTDNGTSVTADAENVVSPVLAKHLQSVQRRVDQATRSFLAGISEQYGIEQSVLEAAPLRAVPFADIHQLRLSPNAEQGSEQEYAAIAVRDGAPGRIIAIGALDPLYVNPASEWQALSQSSDFMFDPSLVSEGLVSTSGKLQERIAFGAKLGTVSFEAFCSLPTEIQLIVYPKVIVNDRIVANGCYTSIFDVQRRNRAFCADPEFETSQILRMYDSVTDKTPEGRSLKARIAGDFCTIPGINGKHIPERYFSYRDGGQIVFWNGADTFNDNKEHIRHQLVEAKEGAVAILDKTSESVSDTIASIRQTASNKIRSAVYTQLRSVRDQLLQKVLNGITRR